jgi:drug/metabolite transporter (DMT)-like permease
MTAQSSLFGRLLASRFAVVAAYATIVAIWGTTWLGIKFSLHGLPPLTGAGARFLVAGAALYALALALRVDLRAKRPPLHLVVVLALTMFGINYALTYLAETHLSSGLVAVLFGTMPFFVYAFAHVMTNERATHKTIFGAMLALAGVATISLVGDVRGGLVYIAAAIVAAASSAFANVYLKRFSSADPLATLAPAMLLAGFGLSLGGALTEKTDLHAALATPSILAVLYLGLGGSALAFTINHWLIQRIDAGTLGLSALMIPVVAVIVGALVGGEMFGARELLGAALVVVGVWFSLGRERRAPARDVETFHMSPFAIEAEAHALALR